MASFEGDHLCSSVGGSGLVSGLNETAGAQVTREGRRFEEVVEDHKRRLLQVILGNYENAMKGNTGRAGVRRASDRNGTIFLRCSTKTLWTLPIFFRGCRFDIRGLRTVILPAGEMTVAPIRVRSTEHMDRIQIV